ncbi:hypothetical protein PAL_GLEAN10017821 [Pteropus alecto]|uniref:Uncharacterized protein n=1 Tax=Pteropus alecto TaxID=9402 RepID=L5KZ51_PTEAL|nr:hypothetical protein PAL_GLEAN10017821 [Pteropus alecto]
MSHWWRGWPEGSEVFQPECTDARPGNHKTGENLSKPESYDQKRLEIRVTIQKEWCLHDTCSLNALRVTYVSDLLDLKMASQEDSEDAAELQCTHKDSRQDFDKPKRRNSAESPVIHAAGMPPARPAKEKHVEVEAASEEVKHPCKELVFSEGQQSRNVGKRYSNLPFKVRILYGTNNLA